MAIIGGIPHFQTYPFGTDMYWLYGWIKIKQQHQPAWPFPRFMDGGKTAAARGAQLRMGIAKDSGPFGPNVWAMRRPKQTYRAW